MSLTAQNIIDRAAMIIQDLTNVRWPLTELTNWLNDSRRELAVVRPDIYSTMATQTLDVGAKQTLPSDGLRLMDIPARYVSGYICPNKNGMRGEGATHAWVEAWIPDYGWLGLDPTNNCIANETHVRLAVGKNFSDCSPVKGTYRGTSNHTMEVSVIVAYEDGHTSSPAAEMTLQPTAPMSTTSVYNNSFRRHLEMQQQQQQQ